MKKNPWITLAILGFVFLTLFIFLMGSSAVSLFGSSAVRVSSRNSILHMELKGVIFDSKKFVKAISKYRKDKHIKAVVIEINSPGGVVGPSQEIYEEIKKVKTEFKKPVVAVSTGMMASGAYYAAVAADKIVVAPGAMMGSIGVIMEFMNLEKLYDWAKVQRYTITTGKYKDSGAEYRSMRDDEKALFQDLINDVWIQFKDAVATGRGLKAEFVNQYADGRVFTGAQGVKLGFADQVGTTGDAFKLAADLAGIGDDYEIFEAPKRKPGILEALSAGSDEDDDDAFSESKVVGKVLQKVLRTQLANKPLFLMPGSLD